MQLTHLRTFITVSRTGGFHAAAERLNITQAATNTPLEKQGMSIEYSLNSGAQERGSGL